MTSRTTSIPLERTSLWNWSIPNPSSTVHGCLNRYARSVAAKVGELFKKFIELILITVSFPLKKLYLYLDPNYEFQVATTMGHFKRLKNEQQLKKAIEFANSFIGPALPDKDCIKIYKDYTKNVSVEKQARVDGTCFGSCLVLMHKVASAGRTLSAEELSNAEKKDEFAHQALGMQIIQHRVLDVYCYLSCLSEEEYNSSIHEKSREDLLQHLLQFYCAFTFNFYQLLGDKPKLRMGHVPMESLDDKHALEENIKIILETLQSQSLKPEIVSRLKNILSQIRKQRTEHIPIESFSKELRSQIPEIVKPNHSGIYEIEAPRHAMLLQVNQNKKEYIFYDINNGFYQWDHLENCLEGIKKHFIKRGYKEILAVGVEL